MTAAARHLLPGPRAWLGHRRPLGLPPRRRVLIALVILAGAGIISSLLSTVAYLRLPPPTGEFGVGREAAVWTDSSRGEAHTPTPGDVRQVRVVAWYPTDGPAATGGGSYLRDVEKIADALVGSGELGPVAVAALRAAGSNVVDGAPLSASAVRWPVVILSPGNATNVEFYGTLAEELASHGYAVVGVDHPYQVTAVALLDGSVAVYEGDDPAPGQLTGPDGRAAEKIAERVADIRFVLDRLENGADGLAGLDGRALDLEHIAVVGHSNGGVAAAELCATDPRVDACLNIDGMLAGGPFSAATPAAPSKPFMFITKETELHPALRALFEAGGDQTYRVVVPAASHGAFADGPRFVPRMLPLDGDADRTLRVTRGFAVAFLDHVLIGAPQTVLGKVDAPTDVLLEVYPLTRE